MAIREWSRAKSYCVIGMMIGLGVLLVYGLKFWSCSLEYSGGWDWLRCLVPPIAYIVYAADVAAVVLESLGFEAAPGSNLLNSVSIFFALVMLISPIIAGGIVGWVIGKIKS